MDFQRFQILLRHSLNFFPIRLSFKNQRKFFGYNGGTSNSDIQAISPNGSVPVRRGEAFWIRSPIFNRYFGPFDLLLQNPKGAFFGDSVAQFSIHIRNQTDQEIIVTLEQVASEQPPTGEEAIVGQPPVIIRGDLDPETLTFETTSLADNPTSWTLAAKETPGSVVEIVPRDRSRKING